MPKLIIAIVISEVAGIVGSIFTTPSISGWYATLTRPEFAPPNWIFAPVWTILFAMMGIAFSIVWTSYSKMSSGVEKSQAKTAMILFGVQLVLNVLWSIIFFGLHSPAWAFVEIIFLWLAILFTIFSFARISRAAAWLLVPYIVWVSFASYLNFMLWQLNVAIL